MKKQMIFKFGDKEIDFSKMGKVYIGKDDWCRCGCGGNYYDNGTRWYNMVMGRLRTAYLKKYIRFDEVEFGGQTAEGYGWVNIPYDEKEKNKCFCFYFNEAPVYDVYGNKENM